MRLGVVVTRVAYGPTGVEVHTVAHGTLQADRCVCALPLGVLKVDRVAFDPPLPEAHRAAMAKLEVGVLDKLYLRFPSAFWATETRAHVLGRVDAPVGRFAEWMNLHALIGQPVLLGFNAARIATALPASDDEVVRVALDDLRTMFGERVREHVSFVRTQWGSDPFAFGSYSAFGIGSSPRDVEALARPIGGRLFFAGEHTDSVDPATTHGARRSGLRAAAEVVAAS